MRLLGNFLRTLATPDPIKDWSLTTLKEKLIKIGAKVVSHGRYVAFQMAEVAIPRNLFADILRLIAELRPAAGSRIDVKRLLVLGPIKNQRERCVWMTTKSTFSALGAPMPLAWVHESPAPRNWRCQCPPKAAISAST